MHRKPVFGKDEWNEVLLRSLSLVEDTGPMRAFVNFVDRCRPVFGDATEEHQRAFALIAARATTGASEVSAVV